MGGGRHQWIVRGDPARVQRNEQKRGDTRRVYAPQADPSTDNGTSRRSGTNGSSFG